MQVILAGYNLDTAMTSGQDGVLTPETLAAAYARISRSPKPVDALRAEARGDVEKARRSNTAIVFDMGHSSIAEHAVFNLDIMGVSRLLVEEIEKFRLCSYTEKSQRYVLFQDDFVIPGEIRGTELEGAYVEVIRAQQRFYGDCYERLRPYVLASRPDLAAHPANRSTLEGWAKEDARYAIALATQTQLGMTANARNLELMIRRLAAHPSMEAQAFSRALYEAVQPIAPSLIRYTEATDYDRLTRQALRETAAALEEGNEALTDTNGNGGDVRLVWATPEADRRVAACLLHGSSRRSLAGCLEAAARMDQAEQAALLRKALERMAPYDAALREFEYVDLLYELTVSASCFAQLKRHRMATLTVQDYEPALGVTMPPALKAVGMDGAFREVVSQTNVVYGRIGKASPQAAAYVLTNAHRRRVALKVNARELYAMSRLRGDRHAQWDIRRVVEAMLAQGREVMPLTLMLACGKDGFRERQEALFGK